METRVRQLEDEVSRLKSEIEALEHTERELRHQQDWADRKIFVVSAIGLAIAIFLLLLR